jgi:hypothetical protein
MGQGVVYLIQLCNTSMRRHVLQNCVPYLQPISPYEGRLSAGGRFYLPPLYLVMAGRRSIERDRRNLVSQRESRHPPATPQKSRF